MGRRHFSCAILAIAALALGATRAPAQPVGEQIGLSPTLAAIKQSRTVRLGFRQASLPFSFLDFADHPIGYSLEICEAIVGQLAVDVDEAQLGIAYVKVTSETRMAAVLENRIDLECGSTTANAERADKVAFSPMLYVAGTKLMVARGSGIGGIGDLKGARIVVTRGTTNEAAVRDANEKLTLGLTIVTAEDHEQSFQVLVENKADAFATDDILLAGLIARHKAQDRFQIVGDYLSYDPYGIMFRKGDAQLAAVVVRTFRELASNRDLLPLYDKWFMRRLPTGERLNIPMSAQLEDSFKALDTSPASGN
jgi:glutamate/aspartate transport system substrate-binding protein